MRALLLPLLAAGCVTPAFVPARPDTDAATDEGAPGRDTDDTDDTERAGETGGGETGTGDVDTEEPVETDDTDAADSDAADTELPTDTQVADDTAETGVVGPPGTWQPDRAFYTAEFGVDANADLRSFFRGGREVQPYLEIRLSDGVDDCVIRYEVDDGVFDWEGSPGAATPTWLWVDWAHTYHDVDFGLLVDDGGYAGRLLTGGRCDDLAAGYLDPSLFEWARTGGWPADPLYVGAGLGTLTTEATSQAVADGVPVAKRLAGAFTFPFTFGSRSADTMGAYGVWAHVDAGAAIEVDPQGDPVLQDASGASSRTGRPSAGWYRVVGQFVITFTPP